MSIYSKVIKKELKGRKYDPRHIEGYMRLQYSTLDHLSLEDFKREIDICISCIDLGGIVNAENNALSFGL